MVDDETGRGGAVANCDRAEGRRRLLDMDPSGVREDCDAAAPCVSGGHLGRVCPRQLTERQECADAVTSGFEAAQIAYARVRHANARALAEAAGDLGIDAPEERRGALRVIVGTTDGLDFAIHERWDMCGITVDDPTGIPAQPLGSGPRADLSRHGQVDNRHALWIVASAVRTTRRRSRCPHGTAASVRCCAICGQPLTDPALPDDPGQR
ncbi:hypothetical protein [Cellulomonas endometrii]|uniref:hypothetical protein n=1 Tax=Cellulomonas endometrii TaxID=3036301 RepID=UPI0024AE10C4|nr:hypothetical protein [Cellulomonas endometrii]